MLIFPGLLSFLIVSVFVFFQTQRVFSKHFSNRFCLKVHVLSLNPCLIPQTLDTLPAARSLALSFCEAGVLPPGMSLHSFL